MERRTLQVLGCLFYMIGILCANAAEKRKDFFSYVDSLVDDELSSLSGPRERSSLKGLEFQQFSLEVVTGLVMSLHKKVERLEQEQESDKSRIALLEARCALLREASEHAKKKQQSVVDQTDCRLRVVDLKLQAVCRQQSVTSKSLEDLSQKAIAQHKCSRDMTKTLEIMVGAIAGCIGSQEELQREMAMQSSKGFRYELPSDHDFQDDFFRGRSASVPCGGYFVPEESEEGACLPGKDSYRSFPTNYGAC